MTRIYTTGKNSKPILSGEVKDSIIEDLTTEYKDVVEHTDNSTSLTLTKDLDPLVSTHGNLKIKITETSISIGHYTHNGWDSVCSYNRKREEWHDNIDKKDYYFDYSLLMVNISNIHSYDTNRVFAENEFVGNDGQKWLQKKTEQRSTY